MLDYKSFVQPGSPLVFCQENFAAIDAFVYRANKLAKTRRLSMKEVSDGLRAVAAWSGGDASRLADRAWLVRSDLSGVEPYNRKILFTVAECRFEDGAFLFVRAGRMFMRANRMPPVAYVPDAYADFRPLRFEPIA